MAPRNTRTNDDFKDVENEEEWDEVESEKQIIFEAIGDSITATYTGMGETPDGKIKQAHFKLDTGEEAFTNCGFDLVGKMEKVPVGAVVRITWADELDTGQKSPMRIYKVQYKTR